MGKIPDAKKAKIFPSTPAEVKLTALGPILVPFTIINNNPWKVDMIPFLLSIDKCSLRNLERTRFYR